MGDAYEVNIRKSIISVLDIEIEFKSNLKKIELWLYIRYLKTVASLIHSAYHSFIHYL